MDKDFYFQKYKFAFEGDLALQTQKVVKNFTQCISCQKFAKCLKNDYVLFVYM